MLLNAKFRGHNDVSKSVLRMISFTWGVCEIRLLKCKNSYTQALH